MGGNIALDMFQSNEANEREEVVMKFLETIVDPAQQIVTQPQATAVESTVKESVPDATPPPEKKKFKYEDIEAIVTKSIGEIVTDTWNMDDPLMDAGMDSLSIVGFRNDLMKEMDGIQLPATIVFEYPTAV